MEGKELSPHLEVSGVFFNIFLNIYMSSAETVRMISLVVQNVCFAGAVAFEI